MLDTLHSFSIERKTHFIFQFENILDCQDFIYKRKKQGSRLQMFMASNFCTMEGCHSSPLECR